MDGASGTPGRALYLAAGWLVTLMAFVLWTVERLKYPVARFLSEGGGKGELPRFVLHHLGALDIGIMAAVALLGATLAWQEIRHRALSAALVAAPRWPFAALVCALLVWFSHAYLHPGLLLGGDTAFHVARMHHFCLGLEQGALVFWDNYFNLGVPVLQFTGPLVFWTGGLLDCLLGDPYLATKLLLFGLHVGAGWAMYRLLRGLGLAPFAALAGAVAYSGAWAHLHLLLYKGTLPQAFTLLFLPIAFLLLDRVAKASRHISPWWSALAVVSGLILINHPSNGAFVGLYMVLIVAGSVVMRRYPWRRVWPMATAGILGVMTMLFVLVPVLAEQEWVTMTDTGHPLRLGLPDGLFWQRILTWSNTNTGPGSNFDAYLGLSVVILAVVGLRAAWRREDDESDRKFFRIASVLLPAALVLEGPHVRTIMFVLFFVSLLAACGVQYLLSREWGRRRVPALLLVLLFLDLGSTSVQPLARTDKGHFAAAARYLMDKSPNERVLEAASYSGRLNIALWGDTPLLVFPVQQLGLPYSYSTTVFHNFGAVVAKDAQQELAQGGLSVRTTKALSMLNFSRIINDAGSGMDMPDYVAGTVKEGPLGRVVPVPSASPVVFASRLVRRVPEPVLDKPILWEEDFDEPVGARVEQLRGFVHGMVEDMGYDPATGSADVIPVRALPEGYVEGAPGAAPWSHRITDYRVEMSRVSLRLESDRAGYIQLAHTWYPAQEARHDGRIVRATQGTINLLVLPVHAGVNEYEIVPVRTRLRSGLGMFSALVFLVLIGLGFWGARRQRTTQQPAAGPLGS